MKSIQKIKLPNNTIGKFVKSEDNFSLNSKLGTGNG